MKLTFTKGIIISLLAFVIGLVGVIVCLTPGTTAPDKVVAGYIDAINDGDIEGMSEYMMTASDMLGDLGNSLGADMDSLNDLRGEVSGGQAQAAPGNEIYSALSTSGLRARNRLPEGVTQVTAVELCGCVDGEVQSAFGMTGLDVTAVLKVTYVDAEGKEQFFYSNESFGIVKGNDGYKIADT
ncbi:MAG: hypothetical protein J6R77_00450 [Clostridia bacterium]|nr:hypothetical protein [Clostridia bacterium]